MASTIAQVARHSESAASNGTVTPLPAPYWDWKEHY
jgi:hypothetical protein